VTVATIWSFKTPNFHVIVDCDYDQDAEAPTWDETGETQAKLDSGEWAQYVMRARVLDRSTGAEIGVDYLGDSIYADPKDFRDHIGAQGKHGSYFTDMVHTVVREAREAYAKPRPRLRLAA
jgi:hypothetical protein